MKEIILKDSHFLVSQTDKKGVITFANDDFCEICGYKNDELIGKPHNIIRHPDMPKWAFKDLWNTIQAGQTWQGFVKNKTKNGDYYWVFATIYPMEDGYMSCRTKPSAEEIKRIENVYNSKK